MQLFFSLLLVAALQGAHSTPAQNKPSDIVDTAVAAGQFKTLAAAGTEAGLVEALKGEGPFTVFAPTDDAFARLSEGTVETLLKPENRERLQAILTYHVVAGKVLARDALVAGNASTLQGESIGFRLEKGTLKVNDSTVVANDIDCSNGVIHVIDTVLLPPEPQVRKVIGIYPGNPNRQTRELLGLERGQGTLVTSVVAQSGAAQAGLQSNDVIFRINGRPATSELLDQAKEEAGVGGTIEVTLARTVRVKVGAGRH